METKVQMKEGMNYKAKSQKLIEEVLMFTFYCFVLIGKKIKIQDYQTTIDNEQREVEELRKQNVRLKQELVKGSSEIANELREELESLRKQIENFKNSETALKRLQKENSQVIIAFIGGLYFDFLLAESRGFKMARINRSKRAV